MDFFHSNTLYSKTLFQQAGRVAFIIVIYQMHKDIALNTDQAMEPEGRVLPNAQDSSKKNDTVTKNKGKYRLKFGNIP
jgi:hypothetical protein